jgi:hypothetical protein
MGEMKLDYPYGCDFSPKISGSSPRNCNKNAQKRTVSPIVMSIKESSISRLAFRLLFTKPRIFAPFPNKKNIGNIKAYRRLLPRLRAYRRDMSHVPTNPKSTLKRFAKNLAPSQEAINDQAADMKIKLSLYE